MTVLATSETQLLGVFQPNLSDISVGGSNYYYNPLNDLTADIMSAEFSLEQPINVVWTAATFIPNLATNAPIFQGPTQDKSAYGILQVFAEGQARSEYFINHAAQAFGQFTFWLPESILSYPVKPTFSPLGDADSFLSLGIAPFLRGDSLAVSLQYGLELESVLTFEYLVSQIIPTDEVLEIEFFSPFF